MVKLSRTPGTGTSSANSKFGIKFFHKSGMLRIVYMIQETVVNVLYFSLTNTYFSVLCLQSIFIRGAEHARVRKTILISGKLKLCLD